MRVNGLYILAFTVLHFLTTILAPALLGGFIMSGFDSGISSSPLQHVASIFLLALHWPIMTILRVLWYALALPREAAPMAAFIALPLNSLLWAFATWWLIPLGKVAFDRGHRRSTIQ